MKQLPELLDNTRQRVASIVCDETTQLYWNVGNAINTFVFQGNYAIFGKEIVVSVPRANLHSPEYSKLNYHAFKLRISE